MQPVDLDVKHLARRYGTRWALADVSFVAPAGTMTMVSGRNGSGKSTLFRTLATAIRPDRGTAMIGGFDLVRHREDIRKFTALLSHYSYLYEQLSTIENLRVTADHLGRRKADLGALIERVGLGGRTDDAVATFSAGMRKRLSLARVLLQEPSLVLLDEPYGQLDPEGFAFVEEIVAELKGRGATILMATHQVDRVRRFADLSLVIEAGRVKSFGPLKESA
jgi:heme exporter protein A